MHILKNINGEGLKAALKLKPKEVIDRIKESQLVGRGGAAFPTGLKWDYLSKAKAKTRYLICNADEGEPGTFKDRFLIQNNPTILIEGIHIACFAMEISKAYLYLRQEYIDLKPMLERAIRSFKNPVAPIELIIGAGAYICGEETSIMNSIEGKRGNPRKRPPFPTDQGVFAKPTCINNVETLANVPLIFANSWNPHLRLFSISGDVRNPGVYERPLGISLYELINETNPKEPVKAISFGAAGGILPYEHDHLFTQDELIRRGVGLGSCALIVIGQSRSIKEVCKNIQKFFIHESCGKCTPCREGTKQALNLLENLEEGQNLALLQELLELIKYGSFCGLGQFSTEHLGCALKYFKGEF